ncbi:MAG: stage II sporulation protein P [Desulfotomaculales bacterium]
MRQLKLPKFFRSLTLVLLLLSGCYFFLDCLFWRQPGFFFDTRASRELLCAAMPMVSLADGGGNSGTAAGKSPSFGPATSALLSLLGSFRVDPSDPVSVLKLAAPVLAQFERPEKNSSLPAVPASPPHFAPPPRESAGAAFSARETPASAGKADVLIYHTHTGETYALTDGKERLDGKRGGVVQAGAAVKEVLETRYGLKVVQSTKIHDADYGTAYLESEKTLRQLLSTYPEARVVLDIHRDAGRPRENSLVKINGQEVAPVLFIVGSDARLPFPTQEQNKKFAGELAEKMNAKYPGLCLGVRVSDGRYNQHLHPRAVLVEMGSACNSTEEAVAGARLFADVLGELVLEILKKRE